MRLATSPRSSPPTPSARSATLPCFSRTHVSANAARTQVEFRKVGRIYRDLLDIRQGSGFITYAGVADGGDRDGNADGNSGLRGLIRHRLAERPLHDGIDSRVEGGRTGHI